MMDAPLDDGIVLMWSGGKDALLALDVLHSQSPRRVRMLLTTVEEDRETVTAHGTPLSLIERQAEHLGIPLHVMRVPSDASNEVYEARLAGALVPLVEEGFSAVAAGDLFLEDVKSYRETVLSSLGVQPIFPLWKRDSSWLAKRFLDRGYQAIVTSVDSTQLAAGFTGRVFDQSFLDDLPEDVDPCGEHGEFHTLVIGGPAFESPIKVEVREGEGDDRMRYARLQNEDTPANES